jgi:hypothetical protein
MSQPLNLRGVLQISGLNSSLPKDASLALSMSFLGHTKAMLGSIPNNMCMMLIELIHPW